MDEVDDSTQLHYERLDVRMTEDIESKTSGVDSGRRISAAGFEIGRYSEARIAELAGKLDEETYRVTQRAGTEAAFCGNLLDNKKEGVYTCVVCGLPLFASANKFDSGTGWPSFYRPVEMKHIAEIVDTSLGGERVEIRCVRCGAHLGHVFEDGPRPTGLRYCLNSVSLVFVEDGEDGPATSLPVVQVETAYFAGGCFWGIEHYFQQGRGVLDAVSGYMQGDRANPSYEEVCGSGTGHAETVKVVFDPSEISYRRLLAAFFVMHDPTTVDRQGPDVGSQYRSGIWFTSGAQEEAARAFIAEMAESEKFAGRAIVTEVESAGEFFEADLYHQDYVEKTGRPCQIADPWGAVRESGK